MSLRKVMGASRSNLIFQFLGESVLVTFIALAISIGLVEIALPFYNEVLNKELVINYASTDMLQITGLALIVGILGGLYPAFVLSNFRPATVLKANKSAESSASVKLRAILVVMQFAVSIGLFISTAVVYSQMQYADKMNPGFNKDNMLLVHRIGLDVVSEKLDMLVKEIGKDPQVTAITWSNETPGNTNQNNTMIRLPGMSKDDALLMGQRGVGYDFFATYEIKVLAGRTYQKERNDTPLATAQIREGANRKSSIVINSSAARRLGFNSASDALGQSIFTSRGNPNENLEAELEIIGVVDDVHFESLRATIRPEIYNLNATWGHTLSARFNGNPDTLKANVEAIWGNAIANIPFSYSFLRQDVADMYKTEQGQAKMFAAFSGLAIFIACLGLYGLANFTATRRTKEIGIRKVMGASVFDIVKLLLWQFSKPVIIANIIAWPIAYWAMSDWLQLFVYRIDNSYILLLSAIAGIGALIIAWVTVTTNSVSVAKANPIKALRYE
ncbi:FtsX-like permease family protein [Psychrosphaera aquimarina]|uniref:FtsX-like permease family protein n=1 Tax=Psychrosphaera aquimarina TaxID=2044854 RepID=A0ABU3QW11_9GAMM|nr:FtsX-like permease family protein [Psychrosphaera aquimarina]MDU0111621.1 FtsX-like permease family protein [Psychrosphaera aquimarina]